jgi:hypothetical protein
VTVLSLGPSPARRDVLARRIPLVRGGHDHLQRDRGCGRPLRRLEGVLHSFDRVRSDSVIEVSSAAAVAWQFAGRDPEAREKSR